MVLNLKVWKSRSLPGLPRTERFILITIIRKQKPPRFAAGLFCLAEISSSLAAPLWRN
jgi:hypothetical protein